MDRFGFIVKEIGKWILVGIVVLTIIRFEPSRATILSTCPEGGSCFMVWFQSLSGWAASAGALYTARIMILQLREQQRQTDFIVYGAPPSVDLVRVANIPGQSLLELVIRNPNKRSIGIYGIRFGLPPSISCNVIVSCRNKFFKLNAINEFYVQPRLLGWIDQNKEIVELYFDVDSLNFSIKSNLKNFNSHEVCTVVVTCYYTGNDKEYFEIRHSFGAVLLVPREYINIC